MRAEVKATIGLCIKNSGKTVETALESISTQDYPHENLKLVIVDEDEEEATLPFLEAFIRRTDIHTTLLLVKNIGLGASRQMVVDNAEGDYLIWVDDDYSLTHDFVRSQIKFMDSNLKVGAARAKELLINNSLLTVLDSYVRKSNSNGSTEMSMGDLLIFRIKALTQIGGFDVKIRGAAEDIDISYRLAFSGWMLSTNKSAVFEKKKPPKTWNALWRQLFWYGYGDHFFSHKYKSKYRRRKLDLFPFFALGLGYRDALRTYRCTKEKKAFILGIYYFFRSAALCSGYINAHLDGYGHFQNG